MTPETIRLSIGIEHIDDILADLDQALQAATDVRERHVEDSADEVLVPGDMILARGLVAARTPASRPEGDPLVIGLVNNMAPRGMRAVERQFRQLLLDAAGRRTVRLRLFVLPGFPVPAPDDAGAEASYESGDALWSSQLDGLIVTGTEPRAEAITDEPSWPALSQLVDWAADRVPSVVWSCYAAHAAVYRLDGIARQPLTIKLSGVFPCLPASKHALLADAPSQWLVPHSRFNGLGEASLLAAGYDILSRGPHVGPDAFVKRHRSLFIFLQGHPEYATDALLREYRRDMRRFLAGERDECPSIPSGYFAAETSLALRVFAERARRERSPELLGELQVILSATRIAKTWADPALRLFGRWLDVVADQAELCRGEDSWLAAKSSRVGASMR